MARITGLARDMLISRIFGATAATDAFNGRGYGLVRREGVPLSPVVPAAILYDLANTSFSFGIVTVFYPQLIVDVLGYGDASGEESSSSNSVVLPFGRWADVVTVLHAIEYLDPDYPDDADDASRVTRGRLVEVGAV